jgi:hypothetical protein
MSRLKPRPTKLPNVLRLRFADSGQEAATHEELGARRQNPNLFCTKRRKDSAPMRVSILRAFIPVPRGRVCYPPPSRVSFVL